MKKVKLKSVSPHVDIRRAESDVERIREELEELKTQLKSTERSLRIAESRLELLRRKKEKSGSLKKELDPAKTLRYNTSRFVDFPTRRWAAKSLATAKSADLWDPLSLVGLYLEKFSARYSRDWRGTQVGLEQLHHEMTQLFTRVGEEAAEAITAVFSPKMKWVNGHVQLLLSTNAYERFVVPAIQKQREERRYAGEQSEFPEALRTTDSCEEVRL